MDKVIVFIIVSVIMTLILNSRGGDKYTRDKDTNELIFRFRSIVRWIALIGVLFLLLLMYKTVPEYLQEDPTNWFGVIVMTSTTVLCLWFYVYVSLTRVIIREGDRIIHRFPFWKKEIQFKDMRELIWRVDRGGGNYCMKGSETKIKVNPLYVDYFTILAKIERKCKNARIKKIERD